MTIQIRELQHSELSAFPEFDQHHKVIRFEDTPSGLIGYIAIHRKRGPLSTGGTRYFAYKTEEDALRDVLRLSQAMTSKCVISGLPYGGAKGVIIAPKNATGKSEEMLGAYAEAVKSLEGSFRTGEDVGMTEADVQYLISRSGYFNGKSNIAGDPSGFAAESVALVMEKIAHAHLGRPLGELHVAVKGVGKVGSVLVHILSKKGATISIADVDDSALRSVRARDPGVLESAPDEIAFIPADIFAPCALGGEVTEETCGRISAKIICGGANNQLAHPRFAKLLQSQGVLYVPDYLANAGGLINVSDELEEDGYRKERVEDRIATLGVRAEELYRVSLASGRTFFDEVEEYVHTHIES